MEKLIIANIGSGNKGKTTSIKEVYNQLTSKWPHLSIEIINDDGDITAILSINGTLIGIESQGDPNSRMFKTLPLLVEKQCQIIVCACRSFGATKDHVIEVANQNGYDLIWASNMRTEIESMYDMLNKAYSEMIVKLIEERIS